MLLIGNGRVITRDQENPYLEDGAKACAYATVLDCIRNGVTTIFDHHASFGEIPGSLFAIKDVVKELGIRSCLCYEVSKRDGEEKTLQSIKENADFAKWAKEADDDMVKAMFGGHALFTISDKSSGNVPVWGEINKHIQNVFMEIV